MNIEQNLEAIYCYIGNIEIDPASRDRIVKHLNAIQYELCWGVK